MSVETELIYNDKEHFIQFSFSTSFEQSYILSDSLLNIHSAMKSINSKSVATFIQQ